jgi:hypothetical protein
VPPRRANLLFDQMKIVEEPLGSRRNAATALDGIGHKLIGITEQGLIVCQSRKQSVGPARPRPDHVLHRQRSSMLFQLADTQQLCP